MPRKRKLRRILTQFLPDDRVFIVDSFPIPVCDFKRAATSTSSLKCADGTGTSATYGKCATKRLDTFLRFRGSLITTVYELSVDLWSPLRIQMIKKCSAYYVNAALVLLSLEIKDISEELETDLLETDNVRLLPTRCPNQKTQYPKPFRKLHGKTAAD